MYKQAQYAHNYKKHYAQKYFQSLSDNYQPALKSWSGRHNPRLSAWKIKLLWFTFQIDLIRIM